MTKTSLGVGLGRSNRDVDAALSNLMASGHIEVASVFIEGRTTRRFARRHTGRIPDEAPPDATPAPGTAAMGSHRPSSRASKEIRARAGTSRRPRRNAVDAENPSSTCVFCGREGKGTHYDHAAYSKGGSSKNPENIQKACDWCNKSKGNGDYPKNPLPSYRGPWPPDHW